MMRIPQQVCNSSTGSSSNKAGRVCIRSDNAAWAFKKMGLLGNLHDENGLRAMMSGPEHWS
jgi:hypothetical protein